MGERWALVDSGLLTGPGMVRLEGEEARHLTAVLRCCRGDAIVLTDAAGLMAFGTVMAAQRGSVDVEVTALERRPRPTWGVSLGLAVLHTQAMDWAVQKAVEVGVVELVPVVAERSQLSREVARSRLGHWRKVALQALKQCRRAWAMRVGEPVSLPGLVSRAPQGEGLVADPSGAPVALLEVPANPLLFIGPEGGLSPDEKRSLADAGWTGVSLGPHILRAETAVVVGAAVLEAYRDRHG
jgi:16S rRNA (uracil1498-N3)-methyltransferase